MSEEAAIAATVARRAPAQQRSRERLERILAVASDLIARKGSDQMKMSEIADLAGISIGSLYQYFPDKSAIIRTLAERYNGESRKCIETAFADVRGLDGLLAAYSGLVDQYYQIVLAEPVMRDIWSGMQVDRQLAEIELAESRAAGALLAAAMMRIRPDSDPERTASTAFLIWHLGEATVRLAVSYDAVEGAALVNDFKRMTVRELATPRD
jgi:AcrR family transcriptional regulator